MILLGSFVKTFFFYRRQIYFTLASKSPRPATDPESEAINGMTDQFLDMMCKVVQFVGGRCETSGWIPDGEPGPLELQNYIQNVQIKFDNKV